MDCIDTMPLVSVIIPVYNVEKYLARCLDSVVGQTYQNLEIILVNDGSTDGSGEICRQYAERDARIRLFTQENQGLSAARNTGLDHMNGEYIVFVDSDDYISPQLIEILLRILLDYGVPIAVCNCMAVEESVNDAEMDTVPEYSLVPCKKKRQDEVFDAMLDKEIYIFVISCCKIFHKNIFDNLRYPEGKVHEDEFVFHKIYQQVNEICYIDLKLYAYRQTTNSIMRKNGYADGHPDMIEARWERLLFFQKRGVSKYCLFTGKALLRDFAAFADISNKAKLHQRMAKLEEQIYRTTGQKIFSWKYFLFKCSPTLYRRLRKLYRTAKASIMRCIKRS